MKSVQFAEDAVTATEDNDCVLLLAIAGNRGTIRRKLQSMVDEFDRGGKPCQGITSSFHSVSHVITPIWKGQEY